MADLQYKYPAVNKDLQYHLLQHSLPLTFMKERMSDLIPKASVTTNESDADG